MRPSLQQFCETGVPSPLCEDRSNWFFINSYELGFNENMETLPAGFYDHNLNPYVLNIPQPVLSQNSYALVVPDVKTNIPVINNNNNDQMQSFSLSKFIQANPIPSLVIGSVLGYIAYKAVK